MCFAVFVGTNEPLPIGVFVPSQTDIYFRELSEDEENGLRLKFSKPYIFYVGSDSLCSCGLNLNSEEFDELELEDKISPQKFLDFISERTLIENLEYYCCWEGEWAEPVLESNEIDIRDINLNKNYFGLIEKEFILFKRQS